jgi:hypothetical protein
MVRNGTRVDLMNKSLRSIERRHVDELRTVTETLKQVSTDPHINVKHRYFSFPRNKKKINWLEFRVNIQRSQEEGSKNSFCNSIITGSRTRVTERRIRDGS